MYWELTATVRLEGILRAIGTHAGSILTWSLCMVIAAAFSVLATLLVFSQSVCFQATTAKTSKQIQETNRKLHYSCSIRANDAESNAENKIVLLTTLSA